MLRRFCSACGSGSLSCRIGGFSWGSGGLSCGCVCGVGDKVCTVSLEDKGNMMLIYRLVNHRLRRLSP